MGKANRCVYDVQEIKKWLELGMTISDIAKRMQISVTGLGKFIRENEMLRCLQEKNQLTRSRKKRKKCATCIYRGEVGKNGCDYIWITGKRRPCSVEGCTVYEKGARKRALSDKMF